MPKPQNINLELLNFLSSAPLVMNEISMRELIASDLVTKKTIGDDQTYIKQGDKAIILIRGMLMNESSMGRWEVYFDVTTYSRLRADFDTALNDPAIKTIYFNCDSGGGQVAGCFELCDYIYNNRDKKKTVALVNESCYSGCYALASSCHEIVCAPSGGAGSVGVITYHFDYSKLYQDYGINITSVVAGKKKDLISQYKPLSEEGKEKLKTHVDISYEQFVNIVARNRNLSTEAVKATEADFFKAEEALKVGFVDKIANIREYFTNPNSTTQKGATTVPPETATLETKELNSLLGLTKTSEAQAVIAGIKTAMSLEMNAKLEAQKASLETAHKENLESAIATAKAEAKAEALAEQKAQNKEILEVCKTLNRVDLAAGFIVEGLTLEQAREKLAGDLAKNDKETSTSTTVGSIKDTTLINGVSPAVANINKQRNKG